VIPFGARSALQEGSPADRIERGELHRAERMDQRAGETVGAEAFIGDPSEAEPDRL
jgi:hypothetical protein